MLIENLSSCVVLMLEQLVINKALAIANFFISCNINICAVTKTWLPNHSSPAQLNELIPDGIKFIHEPRSARRESGLANIFKEKITVKK